MDNILVSLGLKPAPVDESNPLARSTAKIDVHEQAAVRRALENAVCRLCVDMGFEEDNRMADLRLVLMATAVATAAAAHVFPPPPPEGSQQIGVYVWIYFICSNLVALLLWWEGEGSLSLRASKVYVPKSGQELAVAACSESRTLVKVDKQSRSSLWASIVGLVGALGKCFRQCCVSKSPDDDASEAHGILKQSITPIDLPALTVQVNMDRYDYEVRLVINAASGAKKIQQRRQYGEYFTKDGHLAYSILAEDLVKLLQKVPEAKKTK